jgi:hypothetical protein
LWILLGENPFEKGLFPQAPFPKTSISFWQGAAILIKAQYVIVLRFLY